MGRRSNSRSLLRILAGGVIWRWSSKGRLDPSQEVATRESTLSGGEAFAKRSLRWISNCYTAIARRAITFDTPKWSIWSGRFPLLQLEEDDYIHANSIQWVGPLDDLLVSSRHLDTVFLVDRKSGNVKWSLGGKFSKATSNRPVDDPRGGFSHQHYAHIADNKLWVFDNGNLFPGLPSRAVVYQLDSKPLPNRLVFQYPEPNGKQRYALGSVQPLENNQLLIGWGAVNPKDRSDPQRAVSIVRLDDGREVFSMDLVAGLDKLSCEGFATLTPGVLYPGRVWPSSFPGRASKHRIGRADRATEFCASAFKVHVRH